MLNYICSVATYGSVARMKHFMSSILGTHDAQKNHDSNVLRLLVLNTGLYTHELEKMVSEYPFSSRLEIEDKSRAYAEVMSEKLKMAQPFADEDTIYINFDDDYVMNPYWFKFLRKIYEENETVEYLTLLKADPGYEYQVESLSGFDSCRVGSSMGGAFSARWKSFYPVVTKFLEKYGTGGMFDVEFWEFLREETGRPHNIYMPLAVSLIQHCNHVSNFLDMKHEQSRLQHQYGFDFEPIADPFNWV